MVAAISVGVFVVLEVRLVQSELVTLLGWGSGTQADPLQLTKSWVLMGEVGWLT